eukprot:CAMPEP_0172731526 /NCGR_PEP_ID=MMETSP1074-20121228/101604_1 /TAXON_ID=2916 /ORGANISM="Ceratium fusus, Strain PA161109" /LENGTH=96 /DNA_ID=CAMNT_0013559581 /DNA_START=110 /DNA_END=400 /DNA_ORIENTATION=-
MLAVVLMATVVRKAHYRACGGNGEQNQQCLEANLHKTGALLAVPLDVDDLYTIYAVRGIATKTRHQRICFVYSLAAQQLTAGLWPWRRKLVADKTK